MAVLFITLSYFAYKRIPVFYFTMRACVLDLCSLWFPTGGRNQGRGCTAAARGVAPGLVQRRDGAAQTAEGPRLYHGPEADLFTAELGQMRSHQMLCHDTIGLGRVCRPFSTVQTCARFCRKPGQVLDETAATDGVGSDPTIGVHMSINKC